MAIRSPLRAEPRVSEVKRRLAAAEAMQDTLLNLGEESNAALPERAYAGVLDSVRRRFDEAEALQKSLRHALSEELARTQQLQSRLKERPIERPIERTERAVHGVHSPTAQQAELRRELQNVRAERDAASAQCRLQAEELHSLSHTVEALREQVHVRDDEHRELVRSLSLSLGTCGESDLASEELQRRLDAITATRDAALQSAQQERASLEVLQQQLEAMRSERDESIFRLKAEEQRWQVRKDELALAESRLEDTAQRESARRRADAETVRLSTARCAEAEAAKRSMEDQLTEERAFTGKLRLEVQSLKATVTRLQEEIGKAQALQCDGEFESWQSQEKLEKQLHSVKQALDALRVRAQVKESLLEQTELELQKNVRRLTELSSEKAQWQWEAAEQGKAANQLRQRLQMAEEKLLEAVRENRAEAEASFLLAESRKQLATLEDGKRSLMEGLEWEKAEVHRFKAELQRAVQERDLHKAREIELVEVESRSQGTLRKLQLEYAELLAGLEQERSARRHLEEAAWPKERAKWDEELKQERRWRMDLEDEVQVQKRLRQEAEDSLAEVERRLGSIEVEQKKICLVETDRAKQRAENLQLREEILDLTAKLEVERYRVRKLEGGTAAAASGLSPTAGPESKRLRLHAEAREQSDLMALRTLLSTTMRERDEALEKALRLQRVNRSVEELHQLLEKAMQDRERALADQDDLQTLQSTWDLVEQLRAEMPSPSRKHAQAEDSDRMDEFPREVVEVARSPKGAEIKWIIANAEEPIAGRPAPVTSVNSAKDLIIQEASSSPRSPSTSMVSTSYGLSPPTRPKPGS